MNNGVDNKNVGLQVPDDPELLELMLSDSLSAAPLYQPTNYWMIYEKRFLPELKSIGLHDMRRRTNSVLQSFGAGDNGRLPPLNQPFIRYLPMTIRSPLRRFVQNIRWYRQRRTEILREYARAAEQYVLAQGGKPLSECTISLYGNPREYAETNGKYIDLPLINRYLTYGWTVPYVKYEEVQILAELGPGLGTNALMMSQLYPHMAILLFDLPTQLYVCESYLKCIRPDAVVSYRQCRKFSSLKDIKPGGIYILGAHHFPLLKTCSVDLFWNSASFQEMEPGIVNNYLCIVRESSRQIFLRECLYGKEKAFQPGMHGVLEPTTYTHYVNSLSATHELRGLAPTSMLENDYELTHWHYTDSLWCRRLGC
jgi:putative sugar O-methyltransferase